ncbi:MAG: radical SAM protein [Bacteroidota bacterium]
MRIACIKPKLGHKENGSYRERAVMEPHVFALIAAMTPPDVELVLHDDRIEDIPYDEAVDLVAITVETYTAKRAYEISSEYRNRGVPVLLGGTHPTHLPEESKAYADSVFMGDAEGQWRNVIADLRKGKLKPFYKSDIRIPQEGIFPDRSIYGKRKYTPVSVIQFSRGCGFKCNFCSVTTFYKHRYVHRPVSDVVEEIERHGTKLFLFADDNITFSRKAAKELFKALIPLNIKWLSEGDMNMVRDPDLMDLMMKSGCVGLLVGLESISKDNLKSMQKNQNLSKLDQYDEQMRILRNSGVMTWATFTFGYEYDTPEIFDQTLEFCSKYKVTIADFNILTPYPGTPLYDQLEKDGRLLFDGQWWLHPDYRFGKVTHIPYSLSPRELEEGVFRAKRKFFTLSSVLRRGLDLKANLRSPRNLRIYTIANILSYNDTLKKVDLILGDSAAENPVVG